jgi:hypothetical protein
MELKLKECPKCQALEGSWKYFPTIKKTKITVLDNDSISRCVNYYLYVQCEACGIKTETYTTQERAVEVWNKRSESEPTDTAPTMKRYWAFYSPIHYANCGIHDFVGNFDTQKEALDKIIEELKKSPHCTTDTERWFSSQAHIFDTVKQEIVWEK